MVKRGKDILKSKTRSLALATSSVHTRKLTQREDPTHPAEAVPTQPQGEHTFQGLEWVIFQGRAANQRSTLQQGPAKSSAAGHKFRCLVAQEDC